MESKKKKNNVFIKTSDAFTCWDLPDERFAKLIRAVIMYNYDGTTPDELDPELATMFKFFKTTTDNYNDKYEETCERNRQSASKGGGNPNFKKGQPNPYYKRDDRALTKITEDNQEITDINEINLKDRIGEERIGEDRMFSNENDIDISSGIASNSSSNTKSDEAVAESRKSKLDDVRRADEIIDLYNRRIAETGCRLRSCVAKSEKRRGMVLARLREHGEENVRAVIEKAVSSKFLNYGARAAPMDIEWIFGRDNFPKVLEGKYDNEKSNRQSNGNSGNTSNDDEWRDRSEMDIRLGRKMGKGGYITTI